MSLFFKIPSDPLGLIKEHRVMLELLEPDPEKIVRVFKSTINELSLVQDAVKRGTEHPKKIGPKVIKAFKGYEKAINAFFKLADDKTIPKVWRRSFLTEAERMKQFIDFKEYCEEQTGFKPPIYDTKVGWFSITQTVTIQAYLLFKIMKPLVDAHNKHDKEFTYSDIHGFITELLAAVYRDHLQVEELTRLKIKGMIKDISTTSSNKKLAKLHRIIDTNETAIYPENPILATFFYSGKPS